MCERTLCGRWRSTLSEMPFINWIVKSFAWIRLGHEYVAIRFNLISSNVAKSKSFVTFLWVCCCAWTTHGTYAPLIYFYKWFLCVKFDSAINKWRLFTFRKKNETDFHTIQIGMSLQREEFACVAGVRGTIFSMGFFWLERTWNIFVFTFSYLHFSLWEQLLLFTKRKTQTWKCALFFLRSRRKIEKIRISEIGCWPNENSKSHYELFMQNLCLKFIKKK